jgi:hypothetical protein
MRNRQLGVTAIGWLFLLTPLAIVVYAGIRLAPVYLNYMKVAKAMDQDGSWLLVESQYDDDAPLFANLSLHVTFDKKVKIGGAGGID